MVAEVDRRHGQRASRSPRPPPFTELAEARRQAHPPVVWGAFAFAALGARRRGGPRARRAGGTTAFGSRTGREAGGTRGRRLGGRLERVGSRQLKELRGGVRCTRVRSVTRACRPAIGHDCDTARRRGGGYRRNRHSSSGAGEASLHVAGRRPPRLAAHLESPQIRARRCLEAPGASVGRLRLEVADDRAAEVFGFGPVVMTNIRRKERHRRCQVRVRAARPLVRRSARPARPGDLHRDMKVLERKTSPVDDASPLVAAPRRRPDPLPRPGRLIASVTSRGRLFSRCRRGRSARERMA